MPKILNPDGGDFSSGDEGKMPWWVKAIAIVGVPSILALGFGYRLTESYFSDIQSINKILVEHNSVTADLIKSVISENQKIQYNNDVTIRLLRANCINNANTQEERERCLEW